jgi:tetratricopeptide (TPR) repeat protein
MRNAIFAVALLLPDDADALFIRGKIAVAQEDGIASSILERAAKLKPARADIHYWLGAAYRTEMMQASFFRQPSLASKMREQFEEALRLDANYHDARFALIDYFTFAPAIAGGSEEKALQQAAETWLARSTSTLCARSRIRRSLMRRSPASMQAPTRTTCRHSRRPMQR